MREVKKLPQRGQFIRLMHSVITSISLRLLQMLDQRTQKACRLAAGSHPVIKGQRQRQHGMHLGTPGAGHHFIMIPPAPTIATCGGSTTGLA